MEQKIETHKQYIEEIGYNIFERMILCRYW